MIYVDLYSAICIRGIDFTSAIKIYFVLPDLADGEIAQLLYN